MKKKFINITKKTIEDLAITIDCFSIAEPMWWKVNIYEDYEIYEKTLKAFTIEQRYLLTMFWLSSEVNNVGFYQFFKNSTDIVWEDAYKWYQAIGSEKLVSLMDKLIEFYGKRPSFDRKSRWEEIKNFTDKDENKITEEYWELESQEWQKVAIWIKSNSEKFLFQGELEIYE